MVVREGANDPEVSVSRAAGVLCAPCVLPNLRKQCYERRAFLAWCVLRIRTGQDRPGKVLSVGGACCAWLGPGQQRQGVTAGAGWLSAGPAGELRAACSAYAACMARCALPAAAYWEQEQRCMRLPYPCHVFVCGPAAVFLPGCVLRPLSWVCWGLWTLPPPL